MQLIPENFKSHRLWETLDEVNNSLVDLPAVTLNAEQRDILQNRLPLLLEWTQRHKNNASGYYSNQMLDQMNNIWSNILTRLKSIHSWPNNASSQVNSVISDLSTFTSYYTQWPSWFALKGGAAAAAVHTFERAQTILHSRIEHLEQTILDKNQELENQRQEYQAHLTELQDDLEKTKAEIQDQRETVSNLNVDYSEKFGESQKNRREEWAIWLEDRKTEYDQQAKDEIHHLSDITQNGNEHLKQIEQLHSSVEKAANKATASVLARDHGSYANRDFFMGIFAVVFGLGFLGYAGYTLAHSIESIQPDTTVKWQWVSLKVTFTLVLSAAATIAFTLAKRFFDSAAETKRTELELRTIHPFLANVDDPDKVNEATINFINRSFAQSNQTVLPLDENRLEKPESMIPLLQQIIDLLSKYKNVS